MVEVEASDGAVIALNVYDEVVVRLPENATTGYLWSAAVDGANVDVVDDRSVPPRAGAGAGAAGERLIRLRANAPGAATVTLRLGRAWESAPAEERRMTVNVAGGGA